LSDIIPIEPEPRALPFRRPADYYGAPPSDVRPLFPRWVPFGCGAASLVAIAVLFTAGVLAAGGRGSALFGAMFGMMQDEIHGMYTREVTPAEKAAFDAEMKALRANLTAGKVSMDRLQPLLHAIRDVSTDSRVTPEETKRLTEAAREINRGAPALTRPSATLSR
jgi:hypothetical protein